MGSLGSNAGTEARPQATTPVIITVFMFGDLQQSVKPVAEIIPTLLPPDDRGHGRSMTQGSLQPVLSILSVVMYRFKSGGGWLRLLLARRLDTSTLLACDGRESEPYFEEPADSLN